MIGSRPMTGKPGHGTAPPAQDATASTMDAPSPSRVFDRAFDIEPSKLDADASTIDASRPGSAPAPTAQQAVELGEGERYEVGGEFARGGLGRILKARDRRLRRQVAIKELLTSDGD